MLNRLSSLTTRGVRARAAQTLSGAIESYSDTVDRKTWQPVQGPFAFEPDTPLEINVISSRRAPVPQAH